MSWLAEAAQWLDGAGVKSWAGGARYPYINTLHLLGLVMLVGAIGIVDLRSIGAWRGLPSVALSRALTPLALAGLGVLLASGVFLFAADGAALARSGVFQTKLLLIAFALANAVAFRLLWGERDAFPPLARAMALLSLSLWLAAGTCGRMIAYS